MTNKIEDFAKNRPAAFWLLTAVITTVPTVTHWEKIQKYMLLSISIQLYQLTLAVVVPYLVYVSARLAFKSNLKNELLKELHSLKAQLDQPFEVESANFPAKGSTVTKHYPFEILECFDRYNNIIERLKRKWPSKFQEEKELLDKPKLQPGQHVYESEMQAVKSNVIRLIEMLK